MARVSFFKGFPTTAGSSVIAAGLLDCAKDERSFDITFHLLPVDAAGGKGYSAKCEKKVIVGADPEQHRWVCLLLVPNGKYRAFARADIQPTHVSDHDHYDACSAFVEITVT
jgi:hypothetical protein